MIITEHPYNGNENLVNHYSDAGMYILQVETGIKYGGAIDVYPCRYTYTETDEPIEMMAGEHTPLDPDDATAADYENALRSLQEVQAV